MSGAPSQESLTIEPAPQRCAELLPKDRPAVVMTGHQAEFWHPGILAKYLAADAAARAVSNAGGRATVVWLVADQDSNDPSRLPYPVVSPAGPRKGVWRIPRAGSGLSDEGLDTPTAALPTLAPPAGQTWPDLPPTLPSVGDGLARISAALRAHASEPSAARQISSALCDLLTPLVSAQRVVFATDLHREPAFKQLLESMMADPHSCAAAYNAAAARFPRARVRPLTHEPGRTELPLWRMPDKPGRPRRPIYASDLNGLSPSLLAPRALLMTAIVRMGLCDLFIHGTGGGHYDQVTDAWFSRWQPGIKLAPAAVVTATRRLPFGEKVLTPEEITHAQWRAHHALHDPAAMGDPAAEQQKQELLHQLRTARSRGQSPAVAFRSLHTLLDQTRAAHADRVDAVQSEAAAAVEQRESARTVHDRTWPFPLYPPAVLESLKAEVESAFGL